MSARVLTLCTDAGLLVDLLEALPSDVAICRAALDRPTALAADLNRFQGTAVIVIWPLALPWVDDMWRILAAATTTIVIVIPNTEVGDELPPVGRKATWPELPAVAEELSSIPTAGQEAALAGLLPYRVDPARTGSMEPPEILGRSVALLSASWGCLAGAVLLDADGRIIHLELRHPHPEGQAVAERLWSREPWRSNKRGNGLLYSASTASALFAPDIGRAFWAGLDLPREEQDLLNQLAINGAVAVPFHTRRGRRGALAVLTIDSAPTVTSDTQSNLERVAAHTATLLDVADERTTLLQRISTVERLADRNDQLARVAADLSGERTRRSAAIRLLTLVVEAHHPSQTALWELDDVRGDLEMLAAFSNGVQCAVSDCAWETVRIHEPSGLTDAVRTGATTHHTDRETLKAAYPHLDERIDPAQNAWVSVPMVSGEKILGAIVLAFDSPQSLNAEDLAHLEALARLGALNFERISLHRRLEDALTDATAAQIRQQILAESGRILATPLDPQEIADEFAHLCVPALATGCTVSETDEQGGLRLLSVAHVDPNRRASFLESRQTAYPGGAIPKDHPLFDWMKTHDVWSYRADVGHDPNDFMSSVYGQAKIPETYSALGFHSVCFLSLKARGRTIGLLVVGRANPQEPFRPEELTLLKDLAVRAALALDSARLVQGLAAADESKDVFLATLAHELRNPIGAISLAASVLEATHSDDGPVAIVKRQITHLSRLLQDLLDLSRITQGKINLQLSDVAVHELVEDAVHRHAVSQLRGREISVRSTDETLRVRADPVRLTQIVTNLLDNAVKFSSADTPIEVTLRGEDDRVFLSVRDHGRGLTDAEKVQIFKPFAQLTSDKQGLGLGLAIVHQLAVLHNAAITVESDGIGRGSCFTLRLNRYQGEEEAASETPVASVDDQQPFRILLVEDHDDARRMLAALLEDWGHTVRAAGTGESALTIAKTERFDMAVVDIGLPDMTGIDLAPLLRRQWGIGPHLVAVSGFGQPQDISRARAAGFDEYFVKPVDLTRLRQHLAHLRVD